MSSTNLMGSLGRKKPARAHHDNMLDHRHLGPGPSLSAPEMWSPRSPYMEGKLRPREVRAFTLHPAEVPGSDSAHSPVSLAPKCDGNCDSEQERQP